MLKESIVEIFVPLRGSNGGRGEIATGYPVTRERILTVRHPLFPQDPGRDDERPIEVRWRHPDVDPARWWPVNRIAWESERWDLALLDCELPPKILPWGGFLSEQRPADDMQWISVGFPRVGGKREGVREPFPMGGRVYSMLETDRTFAIAESAGPSEADAWKGASGSPVFVNGRILGVIVSVPDNLQARRLHVVPMWRVLREEPAFCAQIGYQERKARRDRMRHRVSQVLTTAPDAVETLAAQLPGIAEPLKGQGKSEKPYTVAEHLLDMEIDQVIDACQRAHRDLGGGQAAEAITATVQLILPAVYDHGVVETVRNACGDVAAGLLTLPVCYPTVAEIIMAGVDRRQTAFCARERQDDFPKGQLSLPEPPECGFDDDGMEALGALDEHLTKKFCWEHAEAFSDTVDAFMVKRFPGRSPGGADRTLQQRLKAAAREIQYQAERAGRTHYLIVREPEDARDRAVLTNTLRAVRERYPGLMCLSLNTDFEAEDAEFHSFRPLLELLPIKQTDR